MPAGIILFFLNKINANKGSSNFLPHESVSNINLTVFENSVNENSIFYFDMNIYIVI